MKKKFFSKKTILILSTIFLFTFFLVIIVHQLKPLPEGISISGEEYFISDEEIHFLYDLTYTHNNGSRVFEHEIFDELLMLIANAQEFIVLDMFLFNNDFSQGNFSRNTTDELTQALINKKQTEEIDIIFVTDNINTFYGSYTPKHLQELEENGIEIVFTDMRALRDSNFLYSALWRLFVQPLGNSENGWLPHPLGNPDYEITLRAVLDVFNAKANHRKLLITKNDNITHTFISSANPHTPSSDHSNVAVIVEESIGYDALLSELAVINFSSQLQPTITNTKTTTSGDIKVQLLTEKKILDELIKDIDAMNKGDEITIGMFYFSERTIIRALKKADERGVNITIILDPNKDAFGREKGGIPNRQVAFELTKHTNAKILWYNTQGEQYHVKMIVLEQGNNTIIYLGSANLTRRNIQNYNLETNIKITAPNNSLVAQDVSNYFTRLITNEHNYLLPYNAFSDHSKTKYLFYRFQEFTGLETY